jgi:tetratricopeptide (TPR) repeat protein
MIVGWLVVANLSGISGCATFGRRSATEKATACRDLTQQGVSAMELGQWQRAELLLQQAVDEFPEDAEAHHQLAEAQWHRGTAPEALQHIAAAVAAAPADPLIAVRAGEMTLAAGQREAALAYAEQAIRVNPQLASAWALRGRIFWQLQQPDRAVADLQRALEFAPDRGDILLDLAVMYRDRGQPTRCLTTLGHLHETCPAGNEPQPALVLEGLALLDLGRPHQACEVFVAATQRGPASAQLFYYLAQANYAAGQYAEATVAAQQALAADASHQASRQLLAQLASHSAPAQTPPR